MGTALRFEFAESIEQFIAIQALLGAVEITAKDDAKVKGRSGKRKNAEEKTEFTLREVLEMSMPDDVWLRTIPPPSYLHLWAHYKNLIGDAVQGFSGIGQIPWTSIEAYARVMPVNSSEWKWREIRRIHDINIAFARRAKEDKQFLQGIINGSNPT